MPAEEGGRATIPEAGRYCTVARFPPDKIKLADAQMWSLDFEPENFHGERNYTIKPRVIVVER